MSGSDSSHGGVGGTDTGGRAKTDRAVGTVRSLALVALVVTATAFAGCGMLPGGGGGSEGEAKQNIDAPREVAEPMEPSASEVFKRVEDMLGVNATAPAVRTAGLAMDRNRSNPYVTALVGLPDDASSLTGPVNVSYSPEDNTVYFNEETVYDMSAAEIEAALAYGFATAIHYQQGWIEPDSPDGYDRQALHFGTTRTVANAYAEKHLEGTYYAADSFESTSAYRWAVSGALQHYGQQYVESVTDSPADIASIYEGSPPVSTEQLLHESDDEPLKLAVNASASDWWIKERPPYRVGTFGEVGTRAILRSHLSKSRAAAAAAGWGNDTAVTYTSVRNESIGTVWVHRWDSPSEAAEFVNASQAFADARESSGNITVNVTRPAPDTTILVAHRGNFMPNAEISYEDGEVVIAVGKSDS